VKTSFLGAKSRRFKQTRVLIIGCGDVGLRVAKALPRHVRVLATTSNLAKVPELRAKHITPLQANLDKASSLHRLASLATYALQLAPPTNTGARDTRTANLVRALRLRSKPTALVYASTTGVYGNCNGEWVDETRAVNPQTDRAKRRVDAENSARTFGKQSNVRVNCLRIPGIYAADREGGDPLDRVRQATPVLTSEDDVYTNHIHANDLARACIAALWRGKPQRNYNIAEDSGIKTGDYYDALADAAGLPRPPRITRAEAEATLSPMRLSFLSESRRIKNSRMKRELGIKVRAR
jgi:nucleoside-diphosphate-sugar epimerase